MKPHEETYQESTVLLLVQELINLHGNVHCLASKHAISPADIYKYLNKKRRNPPEKILELLGLEKRVVYIRKDTVDV